MSGPHRAAGPARDRAAHGAQCCRRAQPRHSKRGGTGRGHEGGCPSSLLLVARAEWAWRAARAASTSHAPELVRWQRARGEGANTTAPKKRTKKGWSLLLGGGTLLPRPVVGCAECDPSGALAGPRPRAAALPAAPGQQGLTAELHCDNAASPMGVAWESACRPLQRTRRGLRRAARAALRARGGGAGARDELHLEQQHKLCDARTGCGTRRLCRDHDR